MTYWVTREGVFLFALPDGFDERTQLLKVGYNLLIVTHPDHAAVMFDLATRERVVGPRG